MEKLYSRINFENAPSAKTPLNEETMNKMDSAIDKLDDRIIELNGELGEQSKNKFHIIRNMDESVRNGVSFTVDKSSITIDGTSTNAGNYNFPFGTLLEQLPFSDGEQITATVEIESGTQSAGFWFSMNNVNETKINVGNTESVTFAYDSTTMNNINFYIGSGITFENLKLNIQIESGTRTLFIPSGEYRANDVYARNTNNLQDKKIGEIGEKSRNKFLIKNNLLKPTVNGVSFTVDKSSITINGTSTNAFNARYDFGSMLEQLPFANGEQITASIEIESGTQTDGFWFSMNNVNETKINVGNTESVTFAYNASTMGNINFYIGSGITFENLKMNVQLETGEKTVFIPYGEYRSIDAQARRNAVLLNKKIDETTDRRTSDYIMDKAVAVSDTWKYTVGDGTQMAIDEERAIVYVLYNTAESGYNEQHDILALSVFPLKQPWRAKFFEIARIGGTYGDYAISHIQDQNILMLDNVVRIFFDAAYGNERAWLYVDFDKATMELSDFANVKMFYGTNALTNMDGAHLKEYALSKGTTFDSDYVTLSSKFNVYDGVIYAMITGTIARPVFVTSSDNGITWELKGIIDADCQYEAMVAKADEVLYVWCRPASYFNTDVAKKMWKSVDGGLTFTSFDFWQSSNTRAQIMTYKDNILLCYSERNESLPSDACVYERNNMIMRLGKGDDKQNYKVKATFLNRFGILYYAVCNYRNELYMAYVSNDLYMSDGEKNIVYFTKIGELYTDDRPNDIL